MDKLPLVHVILTGGTIDFHYDGRADGTIPNEHSALPSYLKSLLIYARFEYTEICMKDSRSITEKDMRAVLHTIEKSKAKYIIVTHGTYTMSDSARYVASNLQRHDQKIVFTGSMIPLEGFAPTDAPFNLGYSLAKVLDLDEGVYVCMNGRTFEAAEVGKNIPLGRFYLLFKRKG